VRGRLGGQVWLDPPVLDACYAPLLPDVQMRIGIIRHGRVHAIVIAEYSFGPRTRGGHRLRDDLATADIGRPRRRSPRCWCQGCRKSQQNYSHSARSGLCCGWVARS